jgi:AcrR family transcriptional regulator
MSWHSKGPRDGKRGYHHGNLREALMAAALQLIAKKGPAGFTFAEAARAAGVSPAAPYRHFRDRDQLIADIARQGFEVFADRLEAAWNEGRPEPTAALKAVGSAYLAFARAEPAYYAAMFESGLPPDADPELARASDRAFAMLRRACEAVVTTLPAGARPPVGMMSFHIWSLSHGIASFFARGDSARRRLPMAPEDLLEAGVLVYLRGLRGEGVGDG